jgi:hypothetical protein
MSVTSRIGLPARVRRANRRLLGGPIAQSVEQLTFNSILTRNKAQKTQIFSS